jgi:hypothetical protein
VTGHRQGLYQSGEIKRHVLGQSVDREAVSDTLIHWAMEDVSVGSASAAPGDFDLDLSQVGSRRRPR